VVARVRENSLDPGIAGIPPGNGVLPCDVVFPEQFASGEYERVGLEAGSKRRY
jgi:hypothetical protein